MREDEPKSTDLEQREDTSALPDHETSPQREVLASEGTTSADSSSSVSSPVSVPPSTPASSGVPHLDKPTVNSPGVLILQWLTYAFWGWTLIALYWLTGLSISYFFERESRTSDSYGADSFNEMLAYAIAGVVVLFVISMICDVIYSRFEPKRKTGAATVIMVIHAVIFALCGIGSLIVGVFAFVNMLISTGTEGSPITVMTTAAVMVLLYGLTLVRTLRPEMVKHVTKLYWIAMLVASVVISGLGIFGPIAAAQRTKDDRAIESQLPSIARGINKYTRDQGELPKSLNDPVLQRSSYLRSQKTLRLIEDDKVRYVPKDKIVRAAPTTADRTTVERDPVYHYQLCVEYDTDKTSSSYSDYSDYSDYSEDSYTQTRSQKYDTTPDTSDHAAGDVCYDLQTGYVY